VELGPLAALVSGMLPLAVLVAACEVGVALMRSGGEAE
jgi:hypothetical protein